MTFSDTLAIRVQLFGTEEAAAKMKALGVETAELKESVESLKLAGFAMAAAIGAVGYMAITEADSVMRLRMAFSALYGSMVGNGLTDDVIEFANNTVYTAETVRGAAQR